MSASLRSALARVRELFLRSKIASEQEKEFAFHIDMEIEHNRRRGMSDAEARRAALISFGGTQRYHEATRDARGIIAFDNLVRDAKFAARRIRRAPGFALGTVLTLGIGIGAAVGIGTMVYGVLLRDLPYTNPDALARVSFLTPGIAAPGDMHSEATFLHLEASALSFTRVGAYYTNDGINLTDGDEAERVTAGMVTPAVFPMLGVVPILGRLFAPEDTAANQTIPVLIAQDLWERRYGGDSTIVGRSIEINRGLRRVVGVLPASFGFPSPSVRVWYPLSVSVDGPSLSERYLNVVARLRPGVEPDQAEAELNALVPRLTERYPGITPEMIDQSGATVTVQPLKAAVVAPVRAQLVLLGVMVVVVLLIAGTNVVNLFLLRTEQASQEIAIALSLGAGKLALAQRFIVEGLLLGSLSAAVAIPVAGSALATKFGFGARHIPRLHEVSFGWGTIAVIVMLALTLGAAIGATAMTRTNLHRLADRLRGSTRATASRAWRGVQRGLVTTQIAIALTLIVAAALLGRSFWNLRNAELGFEPANATSFQLALPYNGYASYGEAASFHAQVLDRLSAMPGVTGAAAAMQLPLTEPGSPGTSLRMEAVDEARPVVVAASANLATAEYFRVTGIPLRTGRTFAPGDLRNDAPAVIVSLTLARALFGSDDPVGRHVRRAPAAGVRPMRFEVIGVAGDVHGERIEDGPLAMVYFPLLRDGDGVPPDSFRIPYTPRGAHYVVRSEVPAAAETIRGVIRDVDRRIPAVHIGPVQDIVDAATARVRLTTLLLAVAGSAALLLGMVGVYSVVSYAAAGRLREFGVRLALGATPSAVASLVLREGVLLAALGVVAGIGVAVPGARLLRSLLYEVSPTSGAEYAVAATLLVALTLLATVLPARRASRTDPAVVLRGE